MTGRPADLGQVLRNASRGVYPPDDGRWERAGLWRRGVEGIVAMTGHAYLAVGDDLGDVELDALGVDGFGGAHHPLVAERVRGSGWADTLDVLLVRNPSLPTPDSDVELVERTDLARRHPRVATAMNVRSGIRVLGLPARRSRSVVTLADGVGGLPEIGIQAEPQQPGEQLLAAALRWAAGQLDSNLPVLAAVAPGNARSLRLFLRSGFVPVGSVQLFRPERRPWDSPPTDAPPADQSDAE